MRTTSVTIFDSLGNAIELAASFEKTGSNTWSLSASADGNALTVSPTTVSFNASGQLTSSGTISLSGYTSPGADPLAFDLRLDGSAPLVQFGGGSTAEVLTQAGNAIGFLRNYSFGDDGTITGQFSNGETKVMGQVATAVFNNPGGLTRVGNSNFADSVNSGEAIVGAPGTGNRGLLSAGTLEMSNIDLALEFTNLIIAQRGFQANSRIITASDEILGDTSLSGAEVVVNADLVETVEASPDTVITLVDGKRLMGAGDSGRGCRGRGAAPRRRARHRRGGGRLVAKVVFFPGDDA